MTRAIKIDVVSFTEGILGTKRFDDIPISIFGKQSIKPCRSQSYLFASALSELNSLITKPICCASISNSCLPCLIASARSLSNKLLGYFG
jgi:hypothetical protein